MKNLKKNLTSPKNTLNHDRAFERKVNRLYASTACVALMAALMAAPAYAAASADGSGDRTILGNGLCSFQPPERFKEVVVCFFCDILHFLCVGQVGILDSAGCRLDLRTAVR